MVQVSETIPEGLQSQVGAAVDWFNQSSYAQGDMFTATGIIDPPDAVDGAEELRLILCGGDRCEQHTFRMTGREDNWSIQLASVQASAADKPQAELDPPPGPRLKWLDQKLDQHAFVVLLFYRGFW
ncbi:MAG: hypothetical protein AAF541_04655 [Pseudomonadota bacterium]